MKCGREGDLRIWGYITIIKYFLHVGIVYTVTFLVSVNICVCVCVCVCVFIYLFIYLFIPQLISKIIWETSLIEK